MKWFVDNDRKWGDFVWVKINAAEVLKKELLKRPKKGLVVISSVTDPYQPIEKRYMMTRSILKLLLKYDFPISILTKSDLVIRDIDLLRRFSRCEVGLTITTIDEKISKDFEPRAPSPLQRIKALEKIHQYGIKTYAFIGPILPGLTNLNDIFSKLKGKVDFVMAEALNTKCGNVSDIENVLERNYHQLLELYRYKLNMRYWRKVRDSLVKICKKTNIPLKGFYIH